MVNARGDRAQLILIGAIAIALAVIGITLVVNAVLYTENVRPSESTSHLSQANEIDFELSRSVRTMTLRVNHQTRNHDEETLVNRVEGNVTRLSDIFSESYLNTALTSVNLSYNASAGANASRLVQVSDGTFEKRANNPSPGDWHPVTNSGQQRLGWAVINLNITESSTDPFHVNFTNRTNEHVNMTFNKTLSASEFQVITSTSVGSKKTRVSCSPHYEQVLLSLHRGQSFTDDSCIFNGTSEIGNVTEVHFRGGENVVGKYSLVAKEDNFGVTVPGRECVSRPPADVPCVAPVVWRANVTVGIVGDGFDYERTNNVSIYPRGG